MWVSGDFGEVDSVAEVLELVDEVVAVFVLVGSAYEPVAAEVLVVAVVGEDVPADDEDGVADRDGGFLVADATLEPPELGGKVGVTGLRRAEGALVEDLAEPTIAISGFPGSSFPAGDVVLPGTCRPTTPGVQRTGTGSYRRRSRR